MLLGTSIARPPVVDVEVRDRLQSEYAAHMEWLRLERELAVEALAAPPSPSEGERVTR